MHWNVLINCLFQQVFQQWRNYGVRASFTTRIATQQYYKTIINCGMDCFGNYDGRRIRQTSETVAYSL